MQVPGRFLGFYALTFAALCAAVVALNVAVDPFYIFGSPIGVWNRLKPAALEHGLPTKAALLGRTRPRTLLLGNSRIEVGFDPASTDWPGEMRPVFNAGSAGSTLSASVELLGEALAAPGSSLKHVLVGIDLLDFLQADSNAPAEDPVDAAPGQDRTHVGPDPFAALWAALTQAREVVDATLTLHALVGSVTTVLAQNTQSSTMLPNGFDPKTDYDVYVRQHGFRDLFDQKQAQLDARFAKYPHPDFVEPYRTSSFRSLRKIVTAARAHDLELTLVIYPYHAWIMDFIRKYGIWDASEAWKRALVRVVAETAPSMQVRIVDFSGYNAVTQEHVPAPGDVRTEVHWYWEPGHFRSALGDRMIARLYGDGSRGFGFGRDLIPLTVDAVISSIRDEAALLSPTGSRH